MHFFASNTTLKKTHDALAANPYVCSISFTFALSLLVSWLFIDILSPFTGKYSLKKTNLKNFKEFYWQESPKQVFLQNSMFSLEIVKYLAVNDIKNQS
jgi:hypothetical protein